MHECAQAIRLHLKDTPYLHITRHFFSPSLLIMFEHKSNFVKWKSLNEDRKKIGIIFAEEIEFQSDFLHCVDENLCLWIHFSCYSIRDFQHAFDILGWKFCKRGMKSSTFWEEFQGESENFSWEFLLLYEWWVFCVSEDQSPNVCELIEKTLEKLNYLFKRAWKKSSRDAFFECLLEYLTSFFFTFSKSILRWFG